MARTPRADQQEEMMGGKALGQEEDERAFQKTITELVASAMMCGASEEAARREADRMGETLRFTFLAGKAYGLEQGIDSDALAFIETVAGGTCLCAGQARKWLKLHGCWDKAP